MSELQNLSYMAPNTRNSSERRKEEKEKKRKEKVTSIAQYIRYPFA